jgi:O-antigen/teichoic acid export membrane protein
LSKNSDPGDSKLDIHLREIGGGAIVAFGMKAIAFGGTFLLSVVAARMLGASLAGLYFLSLTVVTVVSTLARLGVDKPLVRHVAAFHAASDPVSIRGFAAASMGLAALVSLAAAAAIGLGADWIARHVFDEAGLADELRVMAWAIPGLTVAGVLSFAFQGLRRIASHLLYLSVLTPALTLALFFGALVAGQALTLAAATVAAATLTAILAIATWFVAWPWPRQLPDRAALAPFMSSNRATWIVVASQMAMLWAPTLWLGALADSESVARYHVAGRTALLIGFVLIAVNSIAAPKFAALHSQGEIAALERIARQTSRLMTATALPIAAVFAIWPEQVLRLFGSEFAAAGPLLRILAIGQFFSSATGSVANLLLMTGHERDFRNICIAGSIASVVGGYVAIGRFGEVGAAWITCGTLILVNALAAWVVRRRLGFRSAGL